MSATTPTESAQAYTVFLEADLLPAEGFALGKAAEARTFSEFFPALLNELTPSTPSAEEFTAYGEIPWQVLTIRHEPEGWNFYLGEELVLSHKAVDLPELNPQSALQQVSGIISDYDGTGFVQGPPMVYYQPHQQESAACRLVAIAFDPDAEEGDVEGRGLREQLLAGFLAVSLPMVPLSTQARDHFLIPNRPASSKVERNKDGVQTYAAVNKVQDAPKVNHELLAKSENAIVRIVVDIKAQRAYLLVDGQVAIDTPVSTARKGKYTPRGTFHITEKIAKGKTSTIYGCSLPYWMRLDQSAIGLHVGQLPGAPASAGCVRLPVEIAPVIFQHAARGTEVSIMDSWDGTSPESAPPAAIVSAAQALGIDT